jgi:catechol 2,3-dioxygenase-like lactoylglutathione lyase family enzyme
MKPSEPRLTAPARGIRSLRGHDPRGVTVPNLQQAIDFFVDVVGCELITRSGPFRDDAGSFMADTLNVHPRAVIEPIALLRCGVGSNIELSQYSAPDQRDATPQNNDIGGQHIAFYVDDIDRAAAHLNALGVRVLAGPLPVTEGPAAGQVINDFLAPWGLHSSSSATLRAWPARPAPAGCLGRRRRWNASVPSFVTSSNRQEENPCPH